MSLSGCMIGFPNRIDGGTLSGGSWNASYPLTNIQDKLIGRVARSTNVFEVNTKFSFDGGSSQSYRLVSLVNHNISSVGQWRVRGKSEDVGTNLFTYSKVDTFGPWTTGSATVTVNNGTAPDSTTTATRFDDTGASGAPSPTNRTFVASATTMTISIFTKTITAVTRAFLLYNTTDAVDMPLYSGTFTYSTGSMNNSSWVVEEYPSDWYRISVTIPTLEIGKTYAFYYGRGGGAGVGATDKWYVWGAQLEVGSLTSYYPSGASVGVRPAGYFDNFQHYLYDSGQLQAWPSGTASTTITPTATHILSEIVAARYWQIDISNDTNPAGYISVGRVFLGPAWQPTYDAEIGATLGWDTNTTQQRTLSGTKYSYRRKPYRIASFTLNNISVDEAMQKAFEIDRMAGIDKEVFWVYSSTDTTHANRRRFLGTLRQMTPIEYPYSSWLKKAYVIEEIV